MKLSTDNPELMPVTDAVYNPPKKRRAAPDYTPRGHEFRVQWPTAVLDRLSALGGGKAKRAAARRKATRG